MRKCFFFFVFIVPLKPNRFGWGFAGFRFRKPKPNRTENFNKKNNRFTRFFFRFGFFSCFFSRFTQFFCSLLDETFLLCAGMAEECEEKVIRSKE
jgi:hypothetical protein